MKQTITIIGAGLGGCFMGILLAKRGYRVIVYERLLEKEIATETAKKSFSLTMYGYGIAVLKQEGLWDAVSSIFVKLEGSITQIGQKKNTKPIIDKAGSKLFYAVPRANLLKKLIAQAKKYSSISFHFGKELVAIDEKRKTIEVQDILSKKKITVSCHVLLGADGVHSKTRELLKIQQDTKQDKYYLRWSYKQVVLRRHLAEKIGLRGRFSQNMTGKNAIFVGYPNSDRSYSGMFILPQNNKNGFASLKNNDAIKVFLEKYFPDFIPAFSHISNAFLYHPEGYFVTVRTPLWYYKDFVVLLGDAAHAFAPFYGQGVSAAFADCMTLIHFVEKHGDDWETIFQSYQKERKKNTDVLADLSKATFANYQKEKRANYAAIYAKLESLLHHFLPAIFHPPPFVRIAEDQVNAALYVKLHKRQREIAAYLGIPLFVGVLTGIFAFYETGKSFIIRRKNI